MFDLNKLGDMAKIANEAKGMQEKQERMTREQIDWLKKISIQMDTIIAFLKDKKNP